MYSGRCKEEVCNKVKGRWRQRQNPGNLRGGSEEDSDESDAVSDEESEDAEKESRVESLARDEESSKKMSGLNLDGVKKEKPPKKSDKKNLPRSHK